MRSSCQKGGRGELDWAACMRAHACLHAVVSVVIKMLMKACTRHACGFFGSGGFIYIYEISEGQVRPRRAARGAAQRVGPGPASQCDI